MIANIKQKEITLFLRYFATLLTAGVPIVDACETLETSQQKQSLRILIYSIKRDLESGNSLFSSMQKHPNYFDNLSCHMINLGEQTGKISAVLLALANHHEQRQTQKKKILQALAYPTIILSTAMLVSLGLLIFVIPQFAELFANTQIQLPFMTKFIFKLANHLSYFLLFLFSITALIFFLFKKFNYFPLVQRLVWKIFLAKFCRSLSLALSAGMTLSHALPFAAKAAGDLFSNRMEYLQRELNAGQQFHSILNACPEYPLLLVQLIKVGEMTGKLPAMLSKAADFFEEEVASHLQRINTLLEPLIILVLGVLIGSLVISMYLPIFNLGSTI